MIESETPTGPSGLPDRSRPGRAPQTVELWNYACHPSPKRTSLKVQVGRLSDFQDICL